MGSIKLDNWWVAMVVAGVAVFGAGGVAGNNVLVAVGLGLLFVGIGEWINHPYQEQIVGSMAAHWKISGRPRSPRFGGNVLTVAGTLLLMGGALRVAISLFQ